ncbi:MAG: FAD-dependent oxidoreductase [Comamonadaceae bacterium]|nr:FAD-dependent oxidoreductase [Comamonadaceae bacterium]
MTAELRLGAAAVGRRVRRRGRRPMRARTQRDAGLPASSSRVPTLAGIDTVRPAACRLRRCPICDGHEHSAQRVAVLGDGAHAAREALFLAGLGTDVTVVALSDAPGPDAELSARLGAIGVRHASPAPAIGVEATDAGRRDHLRRRRPARGRRRLHRARRRAAAQPRLARPLGARVGQASAASSSTRVAAPACRGCTRPATSSARWTGSPWRPGRARSPPRRSATNCASATPLA